MAYNEWDKRVVKQIFKDAKGKNHMVIHYKDLGDSYFTGLNPSFEPDELDFAFSLVLAFDTPLPSCMLFKTIISGNIINNKANDEECIFLGIDGCDEEEFNRAHQIVNEALDKAHIYYKTLDRTDEDIDILLKEQFDTECNKEADELYFRM